MRRWQRVLLICAGLAGIGVATQAVPDRSIDELARYKNEDSQFLDVDGLQVHYRRTGQRASSTLVLLHGNSASLHAWDAWAERLEPAHDVLRLDLPGFGLTGPHPARDYRIDRYVTLLERFLERLGVEHCVLIGNSMGGNIAWQYALAHADQVDALVLISPSGMPDEDRSPSLVFRLARTPVLSSVLGWFAPEHLYRSSLEEVYWDDTLVTDALVHRYRDLSLRRGNRQAFVDRARQWAAAPIERLGEIDTPTLLLWGEEDLWIPPADGERFLAAMPNATLVRLPEVGHVPMEEAPERSLQPVTRFLSVVNRSPR